MNYTIQDHQSRHQNIHQVQNDRHNVHLSGHSDRRNHQCNRMHRDHHLDYRVYTVAKIS